MDSLLFVIVCYSLAAVRIFDTGGAINCLLLRLRWGASLCYVPVGEFRRVRAATKGRCPLETCGLERPANFLIRAYCLVTVTLSLEPYLPSGLAYFRGLIVT